MFRAGSRKAIALVRNRSPPASSSLLVKTFHASQRVENQLIIGGAAMIGAAVTIRYALAAYNTYLETRPPKESTGEIPEETAGATSTTAEPKVDSKAQARARAETKADANAKSEPSAFASWFARNYYEGGFEEKMSRREAALILGVRETATVERIKEAHRRVLLLNHPDRGGSAFLAAKINEAKDLLLKGRE